MLSLQASNKPAAQPKTTPHLLPFKTGHTGAVDASSRYWAPESSSDGTKTSYFRGRKLLGREVKLPENHRGVVARTTERIKDGSAGRHEDAMNEVGEDDEETAEVKILEEVGTFDEIVVWCHDKVPEDEDEFVRGLGEWIEFSESIHCYEGAAAKDKS